MKIKVIFLIFVLGLVVTCLSVKAEDLSKCKTMFDGKCYEYYDTSNSGINKKCKTMQNGVCTEYFDVSEISNNYVQEKTDMRELNKKEEAQICLDKFGFWYTLDQYANVWSTWDVYNQTRIFVTNITPNSPASRAGLRVGDEILRTNGIRSVKFKNDEYDNLLDSQSTIKLEIKSTNGEKRTVTISKARICFTETKEPFFDSYWGQVCSYDLDNIANNLSYIGRVAKNFSPQAKSDYVSWQNEYSNWANKKAQFRNGFNLCLANNYNKQDVNSCLGQLVNRTLTTISQEQNIEMQRSALQAQQQMQQQQVNAMNNYSNALRNQHVQVDANVYHRGTVNVNSNVNVNGTYNHYFW